MSRAKKNWIQKAIRKPGSLHKAFHVPPGKDIPLGKIKKAAQGKSPYHASVLRKRANLALTLKGFKHPRGEHRRGESPQGEYPRGEGKQDK